MHCFKVPTRLRSDSDGMIQHNVNSNTNLTSSEHSDTAHAEFGSCEDSNSRKATDGGNTTPISQKKLLQMSSYSNKALNTLGRRSSHDNQSLKSMQNSHRSLPTIAEESKEKRVKRNIKRRSGGFSSAFEKYRKHSRGSEDLDERFCLEE